MWELTPYIGPISTPPTPVSMDAIPHVMPVVLDTLMFMVLAAIGSCAAARIAVPIRVCVMKKCSTSMTIRAITMAMIASGGTLKAPMLIRLTENIGGKWKTLLPHMTIARFWRIMDRAMVATTMNIAFAPGFLEFPDNEFLDEHAEEIHADHGQKQGNRKRQLPVFVERKTEKSPYHEQLALDEAHETRSAVDQTVAERDEPVDAADDQGAYQYLQEHEEPSCCK